MALAVAVTLTSQGSDPAGGGTSPSGGAGQGATDPALGQRIPTVTGESFDGSQLSISADGRPKVVMFLAHWCSPCQAEVPRIQDWLGTNAMPTDVDLVAMAIATATDRTKPNHPARSWLRREAWSVPTIVDDEANTALNAFGASGYPYFAAVDADGNVVARTSGEIHHRDLREPPHSGTPGIGLDRPDLFRPSPATMLLPWTT